MIDNKKPSLIFNFAQVDSEEDLGNEIMKSESQEVKNNSFYGNHVKFPTVIMLSLQRCGGVTKMWSPQKKALN